jgi:FAD/FMN-containing dehydrogenase
VEQVALWKVRRAAVANWIEHSPKRALPFIEDGAVPVHNLPQLIEKTYKLLKKHDLEPAIWGHAGTGNIRLQPRLDLAKKKDLGILFEVAAEYSKLLKALGGTPSATHNDSLLRAAGLSALYGEDFFELLATTKHIFDPEHIFNPSKKTGATEDYVRAHLRTEFSAKHLHDFIVYT